MGESCRCCAQPRSWREMLSARDLKSEISDLRSENAAIRSVTLSIERTSPADPRAMYRKARSSLVVPRSNPSAILLETESAARSIWSRRLRWRRREVFSPRAKMHAHSQSGRSLQDWEVFESFVLHAGLQIGFNLTSSENGFRIGSGRGLHCYGGILTYIVPICALIRRNALHSCLPGPKILKKEAPGPRRVM
jgi:hypothetical protein